MIRSGSRFFVAGAARRAATAAGALLAAAIAALPGAAAPIPAGGAGAAASRPSPAPGEPRPGIGFLPGSREAQARHEAVFLETPTPERARAWLKHLTEEPHPAGTAAGKRAAEYVRDRLRGFGLLADLVPYEVLLNHPKSASLRLVKPRAIDLSLREEGVPRDKDSWSEDAFPAFHGYGAGGSTTGQVIYVNYGRREDYERLEELGLSVRDRIVLARYGKVFRGLKIKEAQERGARAVIIYSDPADDGYMKGDVYPDGPMRPPSAIQRGSVHFVSHGSGDPSTPGYASTKGARRVPYEQITGIPKIPSLPLSYGEAEKILRALAGERVPDEWQGGLPFAYHLGPGPAEIEMKVETDYAIRTIYNVVATIPGAAEKDRLVVLGNHRDAWTYGAVDPNSGTAAYLETARGLAAALEAGWTPRRTLLLASWDAEEYGLVGSSEWVEDRLPALQANAVAYVNLDSAVTGPDLDVDGIPSLRDLVVEVAGALAEPRKGGSVLDAWRARRHRDWAKNEPASPSEAEARFELHLNPLGSGSDFTPFVHHAGIASLSFSFEGGYGVYHSIYDDFFWMENFGDAGFHYHAVAARLYGLLAMRLAGADVVPLRYAAYGRALGRELLLLQREAIRERRIWEASAGPQSTGTASADTGAGAGSAGPGAGSAGPGAGAAGPGAGAAGAGSGAAGPRARPALRPDLSPLAAAVRALETAGEALDATLARLESGEAPTPGPAALARLNDALVKVERAFIDPRGLPGRPWFRHTLYAPGVTTGYASWPFPGVVHALKDRDPQALDAQMRIVVERLRAGTEAIAAARTLAGSSGTGS
jgi:N-acetylated-alpha-linked acidic dipeptidase